MITQLLLLSTCGTSVLTNNADKETERWLKSITNNVALEGADAVRLEAHVAKRGERLEKADASERRRLSAEINGISAVLDRWKPSRVQHLLVHSDTAVGKAAVDLVKAVLDKDGQQVQLLTASGLRTDNLLSFREAIAHLTVQIEEWIPGHRQRGWRALFNLTGGFKSVNAYLQALGMIYADGCVFFFEGSSELMEIPRLPVRLAEADEIRPYTSVFRRLKHGYQVSERDAVGVSDSLLMFDDGQATTSVWGDVVWSRVRKKLFAEGLLDPLSPKLVIREPVREAFRELEEARRMQVNDALDALSAHLDRVRALVKSEAFKKLSGNPSPPSTHEFYLWSDGAAWRLFGHYENERFIADSLGPHL
ncbi:MAG TPA: hypothetical protein VKV28_08075 [Candidatus Binataceae bacterium]|nr:hypothetical protein [Candidatus Binataceae bacterium]